MSAENTNPLCIFPARQADFPQTNLSKNKVHKETVKENAKESASIELNKHM